MDNALSKRYGRTKMKKWWHNNKFISENTGTEQMTQWKTCYGKIYIHVFKCYDKKFSLNKNTWE